MTINKSVQRECRWCYGKGQIEVGVYDNTGNEIPMIRVCPRCEGKGYVID
jgi:DnaJ-class molecular chaperone